MECYKEYFIRNFKLEHSSIFNEELLTSGLSIYEVIRIEQGIPLFLEDHLNRLFGSAELSNVSIHESYCDFEKLINELIKRNKTYEGKIKLVVRYDKNNGLGEKDLLIYFTPHSFPTPEEYRWGVKIGLCQAVRTNPNAKILNTEARNKANRTLAEKDLFEVLLIDRAGFIREGSRSNVFFIQNNKIITPPGNEVLNGITRKNILKICQLNHLEISEEKIPYSDIKHMDSIFLTGSSLNVLPVRLFEENEFNTENEILKEISRLFKESIADYISLKKNPIQ